MDTRVYYLEDCEATDNKIARLTDFPCFVTTETIECNYLAIEVACRIEDTEAIDRIMNE